MNLKSRKWLPGAMPGLVLSALCGLARAEPPGTQAFFFRDGDRPALLLGDSITEQRMYSTLIEAYVLTRFPRWNVSFRNVGWSGDTSWFSQRQGFENGLARDELGRLDAQLAAQEDEIDAMRQPAPHLWTVAPAANQ